MSAIKCQVGAIYKLLKFREVVSCPEPHCWEAATPDEIRSIFKEEQIEISVEERTGCARAEKLGSCRDL